MATEARYALPKPPGAPTIPGNSGRTLTQEELAEFMASLEEDEVLAAATDCTDYDPEYND
jgi:hypothetical protein